MIGATHYKGYNMRGATKGDQTRERPHIPGRDKDMRGAHTWTTWDQTQERPHTLGWTDTRVEQQKGGGGGGGGTCTSSPQTKEETHTIRAATH